MSFLRQYKFILSFLALLVFCSAMVVRQIELNQSKHVEMREAFILLFARGYSEQADRLYARLIESIHDLSNKQLMDDFQRTIILVDPTKQQPDNPLWRYHWAVSSELERRSESTLQRALKLAEEQK